MITNYTAVLVIVSSICMPLNTSCMSEGPPNRTRGSGGTATEPLLITRPTTYIQTGSSGTGCGYGSVPSNATYIQPGYTFANRQWLMKGDGLTPSDTWLAVEFTPPSSVPFPPSWWNCLRAFLKTPSGLQYLWTSGISQPLDPQHLQFSTVFKINASTLPMGAQQIWFAANDQNSTFWSINVNV